MREQEKSGQPVQNETGKSQEEQKRQNVTLPDEWRTILDSVETQIWTLTASDTYRNVNKSRAEFLGLEREELEHKDITDILSSKEANVCIAGNLEVIKNRSQVKSEEWLIDSQGRKRLLSITKTPKFDHSGQIQYIICEGHDITEKKRTEEALRLSEEKFSKAFYSSPMIMSITTIDDRRYIDVNDSFCSFLGYTRKEAIGRTARELNIWSDPTDIDNLKAMILNGEPVHNFEFNFRTKSGETRIGLLSAEILNIYDEEYFINTITDTTELRKYEQKMARLDQLNLIGEIAASIGHETRNPMTTVRGFLQLLMEKDEYSKDREFFDLMIEELDRANSIITEFLSLAKDKKVDLKINNLNSIIESIFPLIRANAFAGDKYVRVEMGQIADLYLDEKEMRQMILNIVQNGFEAMPIGGVLIIRTYMDDNQVVLSVQDEGHGIRSDIFNKIGTPFITTKERGTGLGLSVCYSIAQRHNANIEVDTGSRGTTFYIRFKTE